MSDAKDKTISLNVRLKASESTVGDEPHERRPGQGIADVDSASSRQRCLSLSQRPRKMARPRQKDWMTRLSPAWRQGGQAGAVTSADSASLGRAG
jgi:hypothetical protein